MTERRLYWSISSAIALVFVAATGDLAQGALLALLPGLVELIELCVLEPVSRAVDSVAGESPTVGILFRGDRRLLPTLSSQVTRLGRRPWNRRYARSCHAVRHAQRDLCADMPIRWPSCQRGRSRAARPARSGSGRRSSSRADGDGSGSEPPPSDDSNPGVLKSVRLGGEVRK